MPALRATLPISVRSEFLTGLQPTELSDVLAAAKTRRIDKKHSVFTAGEPAAHFFLLQAGCVQYHRITKAGEDILLQWLLPGDVFGMGSILRNPMCYMASADALSHSEILVWDHDSIRRLAGLYPQLAENGLRIVLQYLKGYVDRHVSLVSKNAEQRLAESLINLGSRSGQVRPHGVEVAITNEQLSGLANVSSFTASRLLNKWQRAGHVSKKRGQLLLHTPEALVVD